MATKGENKKQKSISAPKTRHFARKKNVWTVRTSAGPFSKNTSIPLAFFIREVTGIARTMKEAQVVLNQGAVKVNGKIIKKRQFPIGLFDIIEVEKLDKKYRIVYEKHGRLIAQDLDAKEKVEKISKIIGKGVAKGGKIRLSTAEGFVLMESKTDLNVGDSIKISLPGKKVLMKIPMKKGNIAYIIGGTHTGEIGVVQDITPGTAHRPKLIELKNGEANFKTLEKYVLMIGEKEPEIKI